MKISRAIIGIIFLFLCFHFTDFTYNAGWDMQGYYGNLAWLWAILTGIVGLIILISAGSKEKSDNKTDVPILKGVKVLILCPYCGSKTEQGIMKCQNCGADL